MKPKYIVWLLPCAYLVHLLDEFYLGSGFAEWFSELFQVNLSESEFIFMNSTAFVVIIVVSVLYALGKINNFIPAVVGVLFFINGIVHLIITLLTLVYSPGTVSGVLIYIPLGIIVYKNVFSLLNEEQRKASIVAAVTIHITISLIAFII